MITFEKDVQAGGRDAGSVAGTSGLSIEAVIKTKDVDQFFMGLEQAKLSRLKEKSCVAVQILIIDDFGYLV